MNKRLLIIFMTAVVLSSCEDVWHGMCGGDYIVDLYNNSSDTIYVFTSLSTDTKPVVKDKQCAFPIQNGNKAIVFESKDDCVNYKDTVQYFLIDKDTLNKYGLKHVIDNYNVLVRYSMTGADFDILDYSIPYPPSPAMKDMKMYPPYEEVIKQEKEL